jgi:uncharacterized membrane protein (DUF373 family)
MGFWPQLSPQLRQSVVSKTFLHWLEKIESLVSIVLSLAMLVVIFVTIADLVAFLIFDLVHSTPGSFSTNLFKIFGLFLNVLIALELLENITAYLKKHVIQVELVIVTSLIAVARKFIILDLEKTTGIDLIALGVSSFALAISYWVIHSVNEKKATRESRRRRSIAQDDPDQEEHEGESP